MLLGLSLEMSDCYAQKCSCIKGHRPKPLLQHGPLFDMIRDTDNCVLLSPEPALIDGKWWNPVEHFRACREVDYAQQTAKESLRDTALSTFSNRKADGASFAASAPKVNDMGIKAVNGRTWTLNNVRKFMAQR